MVYVGLKTLESIPQEQCLLKVLIQALSSSLNTALLLGFMSYYLREAVKTSLFQAAQRCLFNTHTTRQVHKFTK